MDSKRSKAGYITIRVDPKVRVELEAEAESEGLDLSSYLRHLIHTHHKRQKKKR